MTPLIMGQKWCTHKKMNEEILKELNINKIGVNKQTFCTVTPVLNHIHISTKNRERTTGSHWNAECTTIFKTVFLR